MAFETINNTEHLLSFSVIPDYVKNFAKDVRCSINKTTHVTHEDRVFAQSLSRA